MENPQLFADELDRLFQRQLQNTNNLLRILKAEYGALDENNITEFEDIVKQKQQCATELERCEKQIFELLNKSGFSAGNDGLEQLMAQTENDKAFAGLHNTWNQLLESTLKCNEQNHTNARVINLASISVRQALQIISGQEPDTELYNQSGKTTDGPSNHSVTIA
jgi:flagellar biosynthesis/type III secretory pathway chaperone